MSDPSDDLATRGRAIFQRLRGSEAGSAESDDSVEPEPDAPAESGLTDDELESFTAPPPPERPEPDEAPARAALPGTEDLPRLDDEAVAPPIYVPLDEAPEVAAEPEPPAPLEAPAPAPEPPPVAAPAPAPAEPSAFARPFRASWPWPTRRAGSARPPPR